MEMEQTPQRVSTIAYLVRIGIEHQILVISMGVVFSVLAIFLLLFARNRSLIAVLSFFTLLPGLIALISVFTGFQEFQALAVAPTTPKPAVFANSVGKILAAGFWGLLSTIIPVSLSLFALLRVPSYRDEPPMD